MSGMGAPAEFTPEELDLLEDALVDLELPEGAGSPALAARLASYRTLLDLSAEALPPVEVPEGCLDRVLAEAAQAAVAGTAMAHEAHETTRPPAATAGLWERLRRSLALPGLTLAATATILVMLLRPDGTRPDAVASADPLTDMSKETSDKAAATPAAPPGGIAAARTNPQTLGGPADPEATPEAVEDAAKETPAPATADEAPAAAEEYQAVSVGKRSPSRAKTKSDAVAPKLAPEQSSPADKPADKLDVSDKELLRGHLDVAEKERRRGRCAAANAIYRRILGAGGNEEARALMGLGLCAEVSGDPSGADNYYRQAKAINPALGALIAAERERLTEPAPRDAL